MIDVEGKINNHPIAFLIDSRASHNYLDPKMVERFQFLRNKLGKHWMVQLAIGSKRKLNEMVRECTTNMNGLNTNSYLNITPLGSYDCLIGMDWLDQHHVALNYYNKEFTYLDEEGNLRKIRGIPRVVTIREVLSLQLKKSYMKGCQVFGVRMEEAPKDKVKNVEGFTILKYF